MKFSDEIPHALRPELRKRLKHWWDEAQWPVKGCVLYGFAVDFIVRPWPKTPSSRIYLEREIDHSNIRQAVKRIGM